MLLPTPLFPGCKKHAPVTVAIRTVNGKKGPDVNLSAGDIPIAPGSESSVQDEIKGIHGVLSSTGSFKKIEDYLYEADCPLPNAELAEEHFRARFGKDAPPSAAGFAACSVLNHDGLIGRAYDWKYDEAVTFVVHTPANGDRFASVSICSSPAGITKKSMEEHTVHASLWAILPFYAVDGMNENGVTCSVCVVHGKGSEDILWHGKEFCAVGAVRHVLDRARTAEEGADIIASEAWMPASEKLGGYSLHFMVTDAAHTFIVEDGVVIDITDDDVKAMTNFRLGSRSFLDETGYADVNKIVSYDPYGTGVERYNELVDYAKSTSEATGMREWLTGFVYSDAYRESLLTRSTTRPSEFAGTEISQDHFVKINETEAIKAWFKSAKVHEKWVARERDGKFWQTVHSAVYDVASRMVSVVVQEGTAVHDFPIVREGGGSGTVKSVNDVKPDSGTGNVALTAHDIPYGGESASNVETAIAQTEEGIKDVAQNVESLAEQFGESLSGLRQHVDDIGSQLESHENRKDNPHDVTAHQVGTYNKSEIDNKINQSAAHYLTKRAGTEGHYTYPQFATHADLAAAKAAHTEENPQFFYGVEGHTPDKNDYCVVLADETHDGATTRYMFVGSWDDNGYFRYQYTINPTAFTDEQWAAINSLTSVDEDGNLCFDGIPFINSSGELLFTEDDPIFTAWKNEVQIVLGGGANIAAGKYKQIAIGAHATANGQNAIALGSSEPGGKTNGPRAMAQNAVAIGAGANATATNAVQIFAGTNNKSGTIQLGNKVVAFTSDIPITTADIDDYRYYKGHWSMGTTYKTGDIVRAERTVEGQEEKEVVYFKSLRDNNLAQNPFNEGSTYWTRTTDDEGLDKLSLFVKAAIAGMTGADIPVSPTNADKIDVALGKKLSKDIVLASSSYTPGQLNLWVEYSPVLEITGDSRVSKYRVNGVNRVVFGSRTAQDLATGSSPIVLTDDQRRTEVRAWVGTGTRSSVNWLAKSRNTQTVDVNGRDYEFYFEDDLNFATVSSNIYIAFFGKDVTSPSGLTDGIPILLACSSDNIGYSFYDKHQANPNWVSWAAPWLSFSKSEYEVEQKISNALGKLLTKNTATVLTLDGQRVIKNGTEQITTYTALLALVRNGGVVLLDTVAGTIAKEALFHPHMADETAIRFDATGMLGEKVYTRSFAFTPKSGGGIAVSRGDLTEVAKKSDVPDVVAPDVYSDFKNGKAADEGYVERVILHPTDDPDVWEVYGLKERTSRVYSTKLGRYGVWGNFGDTLLVEGTGLTADNVHFELTRATGEAYDELDWVEPNGVTLTSDGKIKIVTIANTGHEPDGHWENTNNHIRLTVGDAEPIDLEIV